MKTVPEFVRSKNLNLNEIFASKIDFETWLFQYIIILKRTNISKEDTQKMSIKFENSYREGLLGKVELMQSLKFAVF